MWAKFLMDQGLSLEEARVLAEAAIGDFEGLLEILKDSSSGKDDLMRAAHSLKSGAFTFGMEDLGLACDNLYDSLKSDSAIDLPVFIKLVQESFDKFSADISQ